MSDLMSQEGYPYHFQPSACETCQGKCCTGESGYIYVTMAEIEKIAALMQRDVRSFADEYLFKKGYKYSIKEQVYNDSHECIFYDRVTNGCKIYEARPLQCRTFPFWDYFKTRVDELKLECPGIVDV
ncbi:MAG: YkgJ family cysteine cluster protein [Sulfurimonas sp.]|jgi:Fe-S-cluster containining protein|nr:YkgJ family cysteine cluster protein [Sulfurimonas sp.]MDD5203595.1 YkgJ family cysteine cluster protein [Sulfurimonas sp.]